MLDLLVARYHTRHHLIKNLGADSGQFSQFSKLCCDLTTPYAGWQKTLVQSKVRILHMNSAIQEVIGRTQSIVTQFRLEYRKIFERWSFLI